MIVLGINFKHADASACIIKNGDIIAAVEEERFVRKKHYNKFPFNSIKFCLESLNIKINEVDYISLNNSPNTNFFNKVIYSVKQIYEVSSNYFLDHISFSSFSILLSYFEECTV